MCYDILRWVAVHSHFHRLAAVATDLTLKSAKSLKSSLAAAFLLAVNLDFAALTQQ